MSVLDKLLPSRQAAEQRKIKYDKYVDPAFCDANGPQTGISFRHERFVQIGDGYEACLYIYKYPKDVSRHWLNIIANIEDTITVLDIASVNPIEIKRNLSRSMEEHASRYSSAKNHTQRQDAQMQYSEAEAMYKEVAQYGNVMKVVLARIYVPAKTLPECDFKVAEIIASLEGNGYRCGVCLNETKQDYRNAFLSYEQQQKTLYRRKGQAMLSTTFALGNPFHFTSLSDPYGTYYGTTTTGGSVLLDLFRVTALRLSYNSVMVGRMGSGKSTTLKKIIFDRASQGDMIRVFDVTGEFAEIITSVGGKIVSLDGKGNIIINMLQILQSGDDAQSSYNAHLAKTAAFYSYLKPSAEENEILILKKLLRLLYMSWGFIGDDGQLQINDFNELRSEDYPTWSNLLEYIRALKSGAESLEEDDELSADIRSSMDRYVENIELLVEDLCLTYGNIFDGHTSIPDFYREQIVSFDITRLASLESNIFDAQFFSALSLCWDNCASVGRMQKNQYDHGQLADDDISHFLLLIDEAHRIVNAKKLAGVEQILTYEREARKYFGGIIFASQSIRDFVPDDSTSAAADMIKTLFELCTYKWIMNQDNSCRAKLSEIFGADLTENDLAQIPKLGKGEVLLAVAGESNLEFKVELSQLELDSGVASGGK